MKSLLLLFLACRTTEKMDTSTVNEAVDVDGDGYIDAEDCDDNNPAININAAEICDGLDNNCDGEIDEGVLDTYYRDQDEDGFGTAEETLEACTAPSGYVTTANDCNDENPNIYPGSEEQCDEVNTTFCASGGTVSGNTVHGVFCFAPVDAAAGPTTSSGGLTWQPGPFTKITK